MEGVLGIFQNICDLNNEQLLCYLEGLNEHQSFFHDSTASKNVVQVINALLIKVNSRKLGLHLLNEYLKQCSSEVFEDQAQLWTICALKACNPTELKTCASEVFGVLAKITTRSKQSNEFSKTFAFTHLLKIYDSLKVLKSADSYDALECIETCLRSYPGPSGGAKNTIEQFLLRYIDTKDEELSKK